MTSRDLISDEASEMTTRVLRQRDMSDDVERAAQLAREMLAMGLVPRLVRVGTVEVQVAAYDRPKPEGEADGSTGRRPRSFYDLAEVRK